MVLKISITIYVAECVPNVFMHSSSGNPVTAFVIPLQQAPCTWPLHYWICHAVCMLQSCAFALFHGVCLMIHDSRMNMDMEIRFEDIAQKETYILQILSRFLKCVSLFHRLTRKHSEGDRRLDSHKDIMFFIIDNNTTKPKQMSLWLRIC